MVTQDGLDAEQREELQEEWNSYAKGKQRLNAKDLQGLMRQLGTIQTDAETMEMIREAGGEYLLPIAITVVR